MSGVSMCLGRGREGGGALWLPAGGIRASQCTFSSIKKQDDVHPQKRLSL